MRRIIGGLALLGLLASLLGACGDATNTLAPAASGATATQGQGAMPGMTMKPGDMMGTASLKPGDMMGSSTDAMTASLQNLSGKEFEVSFMQDMIAHHQSAVDMAALIPNHTKRPELIKLGQDITSAQTKEIGDMTGWLASWYTTKPLADNMSAPGMMQMMGDMDRLKNAKDADFDKLFLSMMIAHHQSAVNMANLLPSKTQRPELLTLGQNIIKTQTAEIEQMKNWQKAWL